MKESTHPAYHHAARSLPYASMHGMSAPGFYLNISIQAGIGLGQPQFERLLTALSRECYRQKAEINMLHAASLHSVRRSTVGRKAGVRGELEVERRRSARNIRSMPPAFPLAGPGPPLQLGNGRPRRSSNFANAIGFVRSCAKANGGMHPCILPSSLF